MRLLCFVQEKTLMYVWLYVFLDCTCDCVCWCDSDSFKLTFMDVWFLYIVYDLRPFI